MNNRLFQEKQMNKVVLITGGCRGIGKGIALLCAENNYDIALDDMFKKSEVMDVLSSIRKMGVDVLYERADVARANDRQRLIEKVKKHFGRCDVLINNAGIPSRERLDILQTGEASYDRVLDVNLKAPFFLTQSVARWMVEQKNEFPQREYHIINIASISSYTSSINRPEYCISKAGMSMVTTLFADRLAQHGIYVFEIRPGIIETEMTARAKEKYDRLIDQGLLPIKRWGLPADVAQCVIAIMQGHFAYSTGQVFNIDGGFHIRRL
jgi:3-oxoacyl-[acyl-carrier protein] reductase